MGCAYRKAWLSAAQKLFYIHAFLGELTPAERRDLKDNPTFAARKAVLRRVFSLCARRWQGAMADGALCLPPCPLRLPLLFPKISLRCDFREPCLFEGLSFINAAQIHSFRVQLPAVR